MISKTSNSIRKLIHSKRAVALPATFLILFVTALGLISATYYFAIEKIGSESQIIKITTAKQDFLSLDDKILSTIWNPGSSSTIKIADSDGTTKVQPINNQLTIAVNDNSTLNEVVFCSCIGQVIYELPYSRTFESRIFLNGDSRTIINQTGSTQSQLSIVRGAEHPEIHLSYRPFVSYSNAGVENGKEVNDIRIYVINMNSSTSISTLGELPLRIKCLDAQLVSKSYDVNYRPTNMAITSSKDDATGSILVPISSTSQGAKINIEIVIVNIAIERWLQ